MTLLRAISYLLLLSVALLSGCETANNRIDRHDGPDAGILVVSVGLAKGTRYADALMEATMVGSKKWTNLPYIPNGAWASTRDFADAAKDGTIIVRSLPEGEYILHGLRVEINGNPSFKVLSSGGPISIPFEIRRQHVTYVGEFVAETGPVFRVADQSIRDLAVAKKRLPLVSGLPVLTMVPDPLEVDHPMLVR
jgi:hypothetical protein